jgi:hypothetical protein
MKEEFDVSQIESALERLQRNYRTPLPGARQSSTQPIGSQSVDNKSPVGPNLPAGEAETELRGHS